MAFISKKRDRTNKDKERMWAKKQGYNSKPKTNKPAKIALNRISLPKNEPQKWFKPTSYSSDRNEAIKEAANLIRRNEVQYVKLVKTRDEDGTWWGVATYPERKQRYRY